MQRIVNAREKELYNVKLANVVEAISSTIWFLIPYLVSTIFILVTRKIHNLGKVFTK